MKNKLNLGFQPLNDATRFAFSMLVPRREVNEQIIVHHITDRRDYVQLEVERRSAKLGVAFERVRLDVAPKHVVAKTQWDSFIHHLNKTEPLTKQGENVQHKNFLGSIDAYRKIYTQANR